MSQIGSINVPTARAMKSLQPLSLKLKASASSKASKHCRLSSYVRFADMEPEEIANEMSGLLGYGTEGCDLILWFNVVTLEAIESGRDNSQ